MGFCVLRHSFRFFHITNVQVKYFLIIFVE